MRNTNILRAKKSKNDEFYTRFIDIEKELKHYIPQFKGKIVYCNCDKPSDDYENMDKSSQFWNYFYTYFEQLGLKKLIATYYNKNGTSYKTEYKGGGVQKIKKTKLKDNGDFRSEESIEILKESDIVCTNPPFSLFREYISQLMEYDKKFLIIGNFNSISYKEIFPLIKDRRMWLGYSPRNISFIQQDGGKKQINATWFTNLEVYKNQEPMNLLCTYKGNEEKYPKYNNYDAINVNKVKDIPKDYDDLMGVPITYLTKHNPEQFNIIDMIHPIISRNDGSSKALYKRFIIKNKFPKKD